MLGRRPNEEERWDRTELSVLLLCFSFLACLEEWCKCIYSAHEASNHEFSGHRKQIKCTFCVDWFIDLVHLVLLCGEMQPVPFVLC